MRLRGAQLSLLLGVTAWEHVDAPLLWNARPLHHSLEHRQQQGDEPQKHQLCKIENSIGELYCKSLKMNKAPPFLTVVGAHKPQLLQNKTSPENGLNDREKTDRYLL